jgi:hypothetical protein
MQEIKKRRIVLASVLKPVDDPRMYEKIGITLSQKYEVHLIGQPGKIDKESNIFSCAFTFFAIELARLVAPVKILKGYSPKAGFADHLHPRIIRCCTADKTSYPCKIIYDIQENYAQNIVHGIAFPTCDGSLPVMSERRNGPLH